MAYVTPGTVAAGDVATAAAWNVLTNDVIDHESRILLAPQRIETVTLSSNGNISFSSIPQTYSSLRIVFRARAVVAVTAVVMCVRFNGDTGSNYSFQFTRSVNTAVSAGAVVATNIGLGVLPGASADASNFGSGFIDIPQYSVTTTGYKGVTGGGGCPASATVANSIQQNATGQWHNTVPITSVQLVADNATSTFVAGSYATLIGMP